jgi:O-succinylbenzoate synthase
MDLMNIIEVIIHRFRLKLKRPLKLKDHVITFREGFVIRFADDRGNQGWGEISPLINFSRETFEQAGSESAALPSSLTGSSIPPNVEYLDGVFEDWLSEFNFSASVRFGIESAVLNLLAVSKKTSLYRLLDKTASATVVVNGLLSGTRDQIEEKTNALLVKGYRAFKLKVGQTTVDENIDLIAAVRNIIGPDALLRLDANRAWNAHDALEFMERAAKFHIDYLEEPVERFDELKKMIHRGPLPVDIALDETLLEISTQELSRLPGLKAIVIKPMLLGVEQGMRFARAAQDNGITPVISASFESSLGLTTLASMAAVISGEQTPAGLDTLDWLKDDLLIPPMQFQSGKIMLADDSSCMQTVNMAHLEEFAR